MSQPNDIIRFRKTLDETDGSNAAIFGINTLSAVEYCNPGLTLKIGPGGVISYISPTMGDPGLLVDVGCWRQSMSEVLGRSQAEPDPAMIHARNQIALTYARIYCESPETCV